MKVHVIFEFAEIPPADAYVVISDGALGKAIAKRLGERGDRVTLIESVETALPGQACVLMATRDVSRWHSLLKAAGCATYWNVLALRLSQASTADDRPGDEVRSRSGQRPGDLPSAADDVAIEIAPWWSDRRLWMQDVIERATTPHELVRYAQLSSLSGFEARLFGEPEKSRSIVLKRLDWARQRSPEAYDLCAGIGEPDFTPSDSIVEIDGVRYSNSIAAQICYFVRIWESTRGLQNVHTVVEFGGGYGSLARIFMTACPGLTYLLIDLPETLVLAQAYLKLTMPQLPVLHLGRGERAPDGHVPRIILCPLHGAASLPPGCAQLAINTASFQEMPQATVDLCGRLIEDHFDCDWLYSFNYLFNTSGGADAIQFETETLEPARLVPSLNRGWRMRFGSINPPQLIEDCDCRNWLELVAQRCRSTPEASEAYAYRRLFHASVSSSGSERRLLALFEVAALLKRSEGIEAFCAELARLEQMACDGKIPLSGGKQLLSWRAPAAEARYFRGHA